MSDKYYVISLAPYIASKVHFGYGPEYHIAPRTKGEEYGVTEIMPSRAFKDFGEGQKEWYDVPAKGIAEDLVRDVQDHGCFVSPTPVPSAEDLAAAKKRVREWYMSQIGDADSTWARTRDPKQITLHQRIAASELGIKRDWASDMSELTSCKSCHELVSQTAAKCPKCGAILDWEAARDLGLVTAEQERFAVKRGLLKSLDEPVVSTGTRK